MTSFWFITAVLILFVYLLFWWNLRRPPQLTTDPMVSANLTVHRQRRRELKRELAEGKIEQQEYEQLLAELDRELLDLLPQQLGESRFPPFRGITPIFISLGILPLAALALYFSLGRPDLLRAPGITTAQSRQESQTTPPSLEEAIAKIRQRLQGHPQDLEGWILLARSYQATGRLQKALKAYHKALVLAPDNPDLQVRYAEALAQSRNGDLSGDPERLLRKVLATHPHHPYALWLGGMAALQQGDHDQARHDWQRLLSQMPPGSKARQQLVAMMVKAGMSPGESPPAPAAPKLQVTVSLSPRLATRADPNEPVFIFAKAAEGPSMPLAIVRKRVKDLPVTVTLDDSMAMMPPMKLSRFPRVVLGARVAKSGNAKGAPGDLEGWSEPVQIGQTKNHRLVIDQIRS